MTEENILDALRDALVRAGTQGVLAQRAGISQGSISDYLRGRCSIGNMTVSTLLRLFPDMVIDFFGGKSASPQSDCLRNQLIEIFDGLSDKDKVACLAYVAKNFGHNLPEKDI